jgi:hypothetical protein
MRNEMSQADWNDFKIVLALGRGGSGVAAARPLGIHNSTVNRRLAAVEAGLQFCGTAQSAAVGCGWA